MKIIVLHGDDLVKLKIRLDLIVANARKNNFSIFEINEKSGMELSETLSSDGLFDKQPLFILREVTQISPKELKWVFAKKETFSGSLVIINEGFLPAKILNLVSKDAGVETFKLPKIIYKFLDSLYPGNSASSLQYLHKLMSKEAPEFIIAILGRHFRDLYWASINPASLPYKEEWRNLKLVNQSTQFKNRELESIIGQLAGLDFVLKSSTESFEGLLDQLIVTQLE